MTSPTRTLRLNVSDGLGGLVSVQPGDKVTLLTEEERIALGRSENKRFAKDSIEFLKEFLGGDGPYEISWMGIWPCGRGMLYLKNERGEPGAHSYDFKKYDPKP